MDRRLARHRPPWWRHRGTLVALLACALGVVLWYLLPASGSTDLNMADVEIGVIERDSFADYVPARATVVPRLTTLVGVLSGGQVERLLAQDGEVVSAGQPLAILANPELRLDVLTREAQIAAQLGTIAGEGLAVERNRLDRQGQIAQAEYDLVKARRELTIRQVLRGKGILSDAGLRGYVEEAAFQARRAALLRAGSTVEASITRTQSARLEETRQRLQSNLAAVRAGLEALTIRAPMPGRLTNFVIQPGQALKPGDPAGQIDSEGSWKLAADIDQFYLGRVRTGQAADVNGTRLRVSKVLPTVKDVRYQVELAFDGTAPAGLNRGQTVDLRITLGDTAPAIIAPLGGWIEAGDGSSVFVLDADGRHARRRTVRTGRRNPEQVEILSGLRLGDRIIVSNMAAVRGDVLNLN